jgi:hypothetical protein
MTAVGHLSVGWNRPLLFLIDKPLVGLPPEVPQPDPPLDFRDWAFVTGASCRSSEVFAPATLSASRSKLRLEAPVTSGRGSFH